MLKVILASIVSLFAVTTVAHAKTHSVAATDCCTGGPCCVEGADCCK